MNIQPEKNRGLLEATLFAAVIEDHEGELFEASMMQRAQCLAWIEASMNNVADILVINDLDGLPEAFVVVSTGPRENTRRLDWLYTFERSRGKGYGTALVREVLRRHRHVTLSCDRALRRFYEPLGFPLWSDVEGTEGKEVHGCTTKRAKKRPYFRIAPGSHTIALARQLDENMRDHMKQGH